MFDTLRLVYPTPDLGRVVDALDDCEERTRRDSGVVYYVGRAGSLHVRASAARLRIQGSLAGWLRHLGWRGTMPALDDVHAACDALSTHLNTDLSGAHVWRADVFADLNLPSPVACYLPLLSSKPRFQRSGFDGTSVLFRTAQREVAFYDKAAERGETHAPGGRLRVEVRHLKRLSEQVGQRVTLQDLYSPAMWTTFADTWQREYDSIVKRRDLITPTAPFRWRDHALLTAIQSVGAESYIARLGEQRRAGHLARSAYYEARRAALRAASHPLLTAPSPHLLALDDAVADAASRMRAAGRRAVHA